MNDLLKTRLLDLLTESSQKTSNEEIQNAYGKFVKHIEIMSNGNNYSAIYRILTFTRIELASLDASPLYEQEKKCA